MTTTRKQLVIFVCEEQQNVSTLNHLILTLKIPNPEIKIVMVGKEARTVSQIKKQFTQVIYTDIFVIRSPNYQGSMFWETFGKIYNHFLPPKFTGNTITLITMFFNNNNLIVHQSPSTTHIILPTS